MGDVASSSADPTEDSGEMRVDDLARAAGVATTTIRLYQSKGLLAPPRLVGRTGWYDQRHLSRLRVIARLQDQGFSLAAIGALLERWERGEDLADLVGAEAQIGRLLGHRHAAVLTAQELASRLPIEALDPELIARAGALGLVAVTDDGRFRVPDVRFLETGSTLARLGVPLGVVLDEWEHLRGVTDAVAERFATLFEEHLLPADWRERLDDGDATAFVETLDELRSTGERVLLAALDDSVARVAAARFSELLPAESID